MVESRFKLTPAPDMDEVERVLGPGFALPWSEVLRTAMDGCVTECVFMCVTECVFMCEPECVFMCKPKCVFMPTCYEYKPTTMHSRFCTLADPNVCRYTESLSNRSPSWPTPTLPGAAEQHRDAGEYDGSGSVHDQQRARMLMDDFTDLLPCKDDPRAPLSAFVYPQGGQSVFLEAFAVREKSDLLPPTTPPQSLHNASFKPADLYGVCRQQRHPWTRA